MSTTLTNPYKLADAGLAHYCGDINTLDHDGFWYESANWESDGYASCVEVINLPDGPYGARHLLISKLVINKPSNMSPAMQYCGMSVIGITDMPDIRYQIEAVKGYMGGEPDESDYREPSTYAFILLDDGEDAADFTKYANIHNATIIGDESEVWELLNKLVGRELAS